MKDENGAPHPLPDASGSGKLLTVTEPVYTSYKGSKQLERACTGGVVGSWSRHGTGSQVASACYTLRMKAVVITRLGGPEVLELREVPEPVADSNKVLVRVKAGGLN